MKDKPILNLKEIAQYLGVNRMSICRYIKQRKIPVSRVGGVWRFRKKKIDAWLEKQENMR